MLNSRYLTIMSNNIRDFNLVAKFFLGLAMFAVAIAIFTSFQKIGLNSFVGGNNSVLIIEIILDFLILIAAVLTFMKKRYGLIALTLLFVIRMFATVPSGGNIAYSYLLGGNMAIFIRDFGLFAIAMCFRKKGVSGWKSMLGSGQSSRCEVSSCLEDEIDNVSSDRIENNSVDCIEQTLTFHQSDSNLDYENVIDINENPSHEDAGAEYDKASITDSTHISEVDATVDSQCENKKSFKNWACPKKLCYDKINNRMLKIGIPVIVAIAAVAIMIYVISKEYPKNIDRFGDKFKYCMSLPNNKLAREYFANYQKATEGGLEELRKEYITTAWDAKPNDEVILDSLGAAFFSIGFLENKNENHYYEIAEEICLKLLEKNPSNNMALRNIARVYYNTKQYDKAYKIGEQLLMINPQNGFAIDLMCRRSAELEDWGALLKWGKKGYELGAEQTSFWAELTYFYSKGLYETGHFIDAMKYYSEAEEADSTLWLHDMFIKVGGIPCSISSVQIGNESNDGKTINKAGEIIYDDNTRYLSPVVKLKANRTGLFHFDIKLFANGTLRTNNNSQNGYSYRCDIFLHESNEEYTKKLAGWGNDTPGHWKSGGYRIEIWWEGEKLYTYSFNIYSGYWHNHGYDKRFD